MRELLALVVIGTSMIALVAPATQLAREEARRTRCTDNLRQLGAGFDEYVNAQGHYPAVFTRVPVSHGWTVRLLPYFDQKAAADKYDFSVSWSDPRNAEAIAIPIPTFECPASMYDGRMAEGTLPGNGNSYRGAVLDYLATNRVSPLVPDSGWLPKGTRVEGILSREATCRRSQIRDGLACTTLLAEVAGTPAKYVFRQKEPERMYKKRGFGAWADGGCYFQGHGHQANGRDWPGPCAINCTNDDAIYSFHPGGANILYADGSVRFAAEGWNIFLLMAAMTRDNGELLFAGELGELQAAQPETVKN